MSSHHERRGTIERQVNHAEKDAVARGKPVPVARRLVARQHHRVKVKILKKFARHETLVPEECLPKDVDDIDIVFLFKLVERRYAAKSTELCIPSTNPGAGSGYSLPVAFSC